MQKANGIDAILREMGRIEAGRKEAAAYRQSPEYARDKLAALAYQCGIDPATAARLDAQLLGICHNRFPPVPQWEYVANTQRAKLTRNMLVGQILNILWRIGPMCWGELTYCCGGSKRGMRTLLKSMIERGLVTECDVERTHARRGKSILKGYRIAL